MKNLTKKSKQRVECDKLGYFNICKNGNLNIYFQFNPLDFTADELLDFIFRERRILDERRKL